MGLIIKTRFGPRNFVQYLHLKDVYSVGPKPRKKQQVYIKNPQEYIIPQSTVNSVLHDMQQGKTVEKEPVNTSQSTMGVQGITDRSFGQPNPNHP